MQVDEFIEKYNELAPEIYRDPGVLTNVNKVYLVEQENESGTYCYSLAFTAEHQGDLVVTYPLHTYSGADNIEDNLAWIYSLMVQAKKDVVTQVSPRLVIEEG